jgi:hypothetical protein
MLALGPDLPVPRRKTSVHTCPSDSRGPIRIQHHKWKSFYSPCLACANELCTLIYRPLAIRPASNLSVYSRRFASLLDLLSLAPDGRRRTPSTAGA